MSSPSFMRELLAAISVSRTIIVLTIITVIYLLLVGTVFVITLVQGEQVRESMEWVSEQQAAVRDITSALVLVERSEMEGFAALRSASSRYESAYSAMSGQEGKVMLLDMAGILDQTGAQWRKIRPQIDSLLATEADESTRAGSYPDTFGEVRRGIGDLGNLVNSQEQEFRKVTDLHEKVARFGGVTTVIMWLCLGSLYFWDHHRRLRVAVEQNSRNQTAIMRLLDEMMTLAEGDLTVHATVTEDITGAIADSVNYAIDELRVLVETINHTAQQVADAAEKTQATALRLTDASNHQSREIASANAAVSDMAQSLEQVSSSAITSAEVARRSVEIAANGGQAVGRTIEGMEAIREQTQDTAKRIKRLGESSQEIGEIVGLIGDIADQTGILALNAAIQASAAGEAGRGFALVADEVQRLAERSTSATRQIESLVKTIQADTSEANSSMERSTTNVVEGTRLAVAAGEALSEIDRVSNELARHLQEISEAGHQLAALAQDISRTMEVISSITDQTAEGTQQTALSIGQLAQMSVELRNTVSGFRLPAS